MIDILKIEWTWKPAVPGSGGTTPRPLGFTPEPEK